ncbi:FSH1-domain-containing protein [Auriscalpium vulgare]|uniref:FSH1-domain-containing protein n=1 Tax=Auriscalpium vulgare TaxID=40419 RepID=A0ACB8RYD3_9AGAM|nr:FSH1-domain-containing protein [Auriscalpium vulgare]
MAASIPKVLMLHGYSQNASIFSKRVGALRKTFGKDVELVFVDAPIVLHPVDLASTFGTASSDDSSSSLAALGAAEASANTDDPALTPRGWWKTNAARTVVNGLEESLLLLKSVLRGQHFHGVFGFSQGAAMAGLLAALLERPHLYAPFLEDGQPIHPPFNVCVAVSGFKPVGELAAAAFADGYGTPTLHVLGRNDVVVVEERSLTLVDVSKARRVEAHEGGHFVPSKASWRAFLKAYILAPGADVPGPGAAATSQPASGTVTPSTGIANGRLVLSAL